MGQGIDIVWAEHINITWTSQTYTSRQYIHYLLYMDTFAIYLLILKRKNGEEIMSK
jgi:hypothetical protein